MGLFGLGTPNVEKMKANRDAEGLASALSYKDAAVRRDALAALAGIGTDRAIGAISAALRDSDGGIRDMAADVLVKKGDAQAISLLVAALSNKDVEVRALALKALARIGGPTAEPAYKQLMGWSYNRENRYLYMALANAGWKGHEYLLDIVKSKKDSYGYEISRNAVDAILSTGDIALMNSLIDALLNDNDADSYERSPGGYYISTMRDQAVSALGKTKNDYAFRMLLRAYIQWKYPGYNNVTSMNNTHKAIFEAMKTCGGTTEDYRALLRDDDGMLGSLAAKKLEEAGWKPGWDEEGARYWILMGSIGKCVGIGDPAIGPLTGLLSNGRSSTGARKDTVDVLATISNNSKDRAAKARIAGTLLSQLGGGYAKELKLSVFQALRTIEEVPASGELMATLYDPEADIRQAGREALERLGQWKPGRDEAGANYCIALKRWDECAEIGAPAVRPLIAALTFAAGPEKAPIHDALGKLAGRLGEEGLKANDGDTRGRIIRALVPVIYSQECKGLHDIVENMLESVDIDATAVVLLSGFPGSDRATRFVVSGWLKKMYSTGKLGPETKQKIFQGKEAFTSHADHSEHFDGPSVSGCGNANENYHTDKEIGIDFLL